METFSSDRPDPIGPGLAGQPVAQPAVVVLGTSWCPDTHRAVRYLEQLSVPYLLVDIDRDREAEALVLRLNRGRRIVPTVVLKDGSFLPEPTLTELVTKLRGTSP
jgi:glutaredoxin